MREGGGRREEGGGRKGKKRWRGEKREGEERGSKRG